MSKFTEMMVALQMKKGGKGKGKDKGQGVIEYAGALVIAAVLVAAVLAIGPTGITNLFNDILASVQSFFTGQLPS